MEISTLIVDDEGDIRSLMRVVIDAANRGLFVAGEAADGQEALDCVERIDPKVIVLDQRMPGMSGIETAEAILERRPGQRIVMCSAYMDADLVRQAEVAGISACVTKGDIGRISDTLRRVAAVG